MARPGGWFPDPGRVHEMRYFDGTTWTDHVADAGVVTQARLGPLPSDRVVDVPRVKMWILAVLSLFVFSVHTPGTSLVLPLGIVFAFWCWRTTQAALESHARAHSPAVSEIKAARWVAVGLAALAVVQTVARLR